MSEVEEEVRRALAEVYRPDGVDAWLHAPHQLLDDERPIDVIAQGGAERVLQIVAQLVDGVFL